MPRASKPWYITPWLSAELWNSLSWIEYGKIDIDELEADDWSLATGIPVGGHSLP